MKQEKAQSDSKPDSSWQDPETRYVHKPRLVETEIPNPIQGPVRGPDPLYQFMRDVHDETVPKMWGIFLNEGRYSIGNEPLAIGDAALPGRVSMKAIAHYASVFYAAHVVLLTNRPNNDPSPTDADRDLIHQAKQALGVLEINLADYVIVGGKQYWSMTQQDGTACDCGSQHHWDDQRR